MHLIVYSSKMQSTGLSDKQVLDDIITTALKRNAQENLTGVLLFENGYFLQAIEGEEGALRSVFESIKDDKRHGDLYCHVDQEIDERSFTNWSMETFRIDNPDIFDTENIGIIRKLYERTFKMNSRSLIEFIKNILDEIDTFKIGQQIT